MKRRNSGLSPDHSRPRARPENLQAQIVEIADRDLARREHAARAADETQQHMRVVVQPPPRHESRQIRRDRIDLEAGDEQRQIVRVHADVGEARRGAGARGIGAPFRLLLAIGVDRLRQPVLDIGGVDDPDVADLAGSDHFARLPDHGIAGVVERHCEHQPSRAREFDEFTSASCNVVDSGLSQITSMPAARNALATG